MSEKTKIINLAEAEKLGKSTAEYKAEKVGLSQVLEDLLKQTPYLQN